MMLTDLADVLRAAGLRVVEVPGWKTRGYLGQQMSGAKSVLCHWTGTNPAAAGDYPTLNTILNGNANTPGPLSQTGLGRDGTWYVIAAGLCNHAGTVDRWECSNPNSIGVEAEYHPDQGAWPDVQQRSYERGCAALRAHYGIPLELVRGHYEAATPYGRKPDPNTLPGGMPGFRQRVAAADLNTNPEEEDDDMIRFIQATGDPKLYALTAEGIRPVDNMEEFELYKAVTGRGVHSVTPQVLAKLTKSGASVWNYSIPVSDSNPFGQSFRPAHRVVAGIYEKASSVVADVDEEALAAALEARGIDGASPAEVKQAMIEVLKSVS